METDLQRVNGMIFVLVPKLSMGKLSLPSPSLRENTLCLWYLKQGNLHEDLCLHIQIDILKYDVKVDLLYIVTSIAHVKKYLKVTCYGSEKKKEILY